MRLKLVLHLLACIYTIQLFSQPRYKNVEIVWGHEYEASGKFSLNSIVGYDNTGIYAIKTKLKDMLWGGRSSYEEMYGIGPKMFLEHYDNDMNLTKSVELDFEKLGKRTKFEYIMHLNDRLFLFSSSRSKKTDIYNLHAQVVDKETLQLGKEHFTIAEIEFSNYTYYNTRLSGYRMSRDSSKVLVYYTLPYRERENIQFRFKLFDQNLSELWVKDITLPYSEKRFEDIKIRTDNQGSIYILGRLFAAKKSLFDAGVQDYNYRILQYTNSGNTFIEHEVSFADKFLTDIQIAINDKQEIYCSGFYSNKRSIGINGAFFLKIDGPTSQLINQSLMPFGDDFVAQDRKKKRREKVDINADIGKDADIKYLVLDEIALREDGGAVLIGEQYYVQVYTSTYVSGNSSTSYNFHYNDIIVVGINPDGTIDWVDKIVKRQATSNDNGFFSSYALAVVDSKLYFIFNDNPKNLFYKEDGEVYHFNKLSREAIVTILELDTKGNQNRKALFASRDAGVMTRPMVCSQISENELIVYGEWRKSHRFAKVRFK